MIFEIIYKIYIKSDASVNHRDVRDPIQRGTKDSLNNRHTRHLGESWNFCSPSVELASKKGIFYSNEYLIEKFPFV